MHQRCSCVRMKISPSESACEEFVSEILDRGLCLRGIKHEGVDLPGEEFDRFVKTAAGIMAARRVCTSLHIKPEEEHFRFNFSC